MSVVRGRLRALKERARAGGSKADRRNEDVLRSECWMQMRVSGSFQQVKQALHTQPLSFDEGADLRAIAVAPVSRVQPQQVFHRAASLRRAVAPTRCMSEIVSLSARVPCAVMRYGRRRSSPASASM